MKDYTTQQEHINALSSWVTLTVSKQYLSTCCRATETLREWYKNLRTRVQPSEDQVYLEVWKEYADITRALTRPPKNPYTWLKRWTLTVKKAIQLNIITADKPITWLTGFIEPVNKWKSEWITKYKTQYLKEAKDGTLTFR